MEMLISRNELPHRNAKIASSSSTEVSRRSKVFIDMRR